MRRFTFFIACFCILVFSLQGQVQSVRVNNSALASITWKLPLLSRQNTSEKNFRIQAGIKSDSQITSVSVVINRQMTRGVLLTVNDGFDFAVNQEIPLAKGMNEVMIVVENKAGKSVSEIRYVNYQTITHDVAYTTHKRLALVVGNADYQYFPLANPVNDAKDISAKLKNLGFDVILLTNKTKEQMEHAIDNFGSKAKDYDVAMFFYAGHAIQHNGKNYLLPVNVSSWDVDDEWKIEHDCMPVDRVLTNMEYSKCKLKLVVLDACRDNLFRSIYGIGLSPVNASAGTFIAYSTSPNTKALDGTGRNSPYTAELLKRIDTKQLKIEDLFKQVRKGVLEKTNGQQLPWDQSSIVGEFFFNY